MASFKTWHSRQTIFGFRFLENTKSAIMPKLKQLMKNFKHMPGPHIKKWIKLILRLFDWTPYVPLFSFYIIISIIISFAILVGHLPVYGVDLDPSSYTSIGDGTIDKNIIVIVTAGFCLSPLFLPLSLIFRTSKQIKFRVIIYVCGIVLCLLLRVTSSFVWLVD